MEFDFLGDRCSLADCRRHDFLPFKCDHCNARFCSEHVGRKEHRCPTLADTAPTEPLPCHGCGEVIAWVAQTATAAEKAAIRRQHAPVCTRARAKAPVCAVPGCGERLASPVACVRCELRHCVKHRLPAKHACAFADVAPPLTRPPPVRKSRTSALAPAPTGYENSALAPAGDKRLDGADRLYVEVAFAGAQADAMDARKRVYFFFSRRWTAGRALDAIAAHAKIPIRTHDGRRLRLRVDDVVCDTLDRLADRVVQHAVVIVEYEPTVQPRGVGAEELESSLLCLDLNRTC